MASQPGVFNPQALTDSGAPAAGYRLYTLVQGTTTHKAAFTDAAGLVAHTYTSDGIGGLYIALNSRGELPAPLFLASGVYDLTLKTPGGATVWTRYAKGADDAADSADASLRADLASTSSATKNAGQVGYDASLGYASGTVGEALGRTVNVLDDMTDAQRIDAKNKTLTLDMSPAIMAASARAGAYGTVIFPDGYAFRCETPLTCAFDHQKWFGYGTRLAFFPSAPGTLLTFKNGSGSIWGAGLFGFHLWSSDATHAKTALELYDARSFTMADVFIFGSVVRAGNNTWSGGAASTGIRIRGRELISFNKTYIAADRPISIGECPNTAILSIDQSRFRDTILIAYQQPAIEIDTGVIWTQTGFDGYLSKNGGRETIKWIDTTSTTVSNGFTIDELRSEQEENAADFVINIQHNSTLQSLRIRGGYWGNTNGVRLRKCDRVRLDSIYHGTTGTVALDVDGTVGGVDADNCFWQSGATASVVGQRYLSGAPKLPNGAPLPPSFKIEPTTNTKRDLLADGAISQTPFTLANNATLSLGANLQGVLSVTTDEGFGALFVVHGSQAVIELVGTTTSSTYFSNTAATASKLNIYWSGSEYVAENKRGSSRNVKITLLGSYGPF